LEATFPDIAAEGIRHALGIRQWSHSEQDEYAAVLKCAREENWRVVCEEVGYTHVGTGGQGYVSFMTELGECRFYSTTELAKMLPASWTRANALDTWKALEAPRGIDPLIVTWSEHRRENDGSVYLMVDAVEPLGDLDAILNGEKE